jgi:hypothetical protein
MDSFLCFDLVALNRNLDQSGQICCCPLTCQLRILFGHAFITFEIFMDVTKLIQRALGGQSLPDLFAL